MKQLRLEITTTTPSSDPERIPKFFHSLSTQCTSLGNLELTLDEDLPNVTYDHSQKTFDIPSNFFEIVVNYKGRLCPENKNLKIEFRHNINFGLVADSQEAVDFYVEEIKKVLSGFEYSISDEDCIDHHHFKTSSEIPKNMKLKIHIKLSYCDYFNGILDF